MTHPRVSIIWLNYNSMRISDIMIRSLKSFLNLDYENYELIVVDNASTDGSLNLIKKFLDKNKPSNVKVKLVINDANLGYAGGMNRGWDARDPESKYVVFANNDFIAEPESLPRIIEFMEDIDKIAAANGLLLLPDGKIYSVGGAVDELLNAIPIGNNMSTAECSTINEPHAITYAEGTYYFVKADYVLKYGFAQKPFIDEIFLYWDDILLSLKLWNVGLASYYVPVKAGVHYASLTTKQLGLIDYYAVRARFIAHELVETRNELWKNMYIWKLKLVLPVLRKLGIKRYIDAYKAIFDGLKTGKKLVKKFGRICLKKAPYIKTPLYISVLRAILPTRTIKSINKHAKIISHDALTKPHNIQTNTIR